jgi:hypothetical protein
MIVEQMNEPKTRQEFENRINVLVEAIREGRKKYPAGSGAIEGLMKLRSLPNRRLDLCSINETARVQANSYSHFLNIDFSKILKDEK